MMYFSEILEFCAVTMKNYLLFKNFCNADENSFSPKTGFTCTMDMDDFDFFMENHPIKKSKQGFKKCPQLSCFSIIHYSGDMIEWMIKSAIYSFHSSNTAMNNFIVNAYGEDLIGFHLINHFDSKNGS